MEKYKIKKKILDLKIYFYLKKKKEKKIFRFLFKINIINLFFLNNQ